jgi:hypothetical protein
LVKVYAERIAVGNGLCRWLSITAIGVHFTSSSTYQPVGCQGTRLRPFADGDGKQTVVIGIATECLDNFSIPIVAVGVYPDMPTAFWKP